MHPSPLTERTFDALASAPTVLLEFGAEWCHPCRVFAPVEDVAGNNPDVVFATVDVDEEPGLRERFDVRAVPMLIALRDGVVVFRRSGALSAQVLHRRDHRPAHPSPSRSHPIRATGHRPGDDCCRTRRHAARTGGPGPRRSCLPRRSTPISRMRSTISPRSSAVARHLDDCRRCGMEAETYRELKARLHGLGAPVDEDAVRRLRAFVEELSEDA